MTRRSFQVRAGRAAAARPPTTNASIRYALLDLLGEPVAECDALGIPMPAYEIDDETAIRAVDGTANIVSDGRWKLLAP